MVNRLTKIYTKVGDGGSTLLASGQRVPKSDPRIEAYGTVDELNSFVALLLDHLPRELSQDLKSSLLQIQNELFDVGGELSVPPPHLNPDLQQVVTKASIKRLEDEMDGMNEHLPPLKNFVLPGGHPANSYAHVCRTICRRAERRVVRLAAQEEVRSEVQVYLNRLSDWFFLLSRDISRRLKVEEVLWSQNRKR